MAESADVIYLRQQQEINEEYNATVAKVTPTGAEVRLTPRQIARVLAALEGATDDEALSIRALLEPVPAPERPLDGVDLSGYTDEEIAGQSLDPTDLSFWYGGVSEATASTLGDQYVTYSRDALIPKPPYGWLGPARRTPTGAWLRLVRVPLTRSRLGRNRVENQGVESRTAR